MVNQLLNNNLRENMFLCLKLNMLKSYLLFVDYYGPLRGVPLIKQRKFVPALPLLQHPFSIN